MPRIDLPDGRWVELRPQYLSEKNRILELPAKVAEGRLIDLLNGYADIIRPAVLALSWEGDITDMPELRLVELIRQWARITEDDAVPPASGTTGKPTSCRPASTRRRSGSRTPRSGSTSAP